MAAVYRAADTVLQRDIALKVLYPQYSDDASLVERFKREAVTAAALEHPGIVPVYDVGEHDGMAYIAMKLLSGRTLQDRLQEAGAISLEELLAVLGPVAAALDYAHGRGVIHRDIKPGNIFLSQEGEGARPLLTDFGIAKQLDAPGLTTTGALIGTPDYMAPEQIAGRAVDARVDVYALGMLAFRALAGRRAFEGSTQDVLLGHLYGQAPLLSELSPGLPQGLDAAVARALAVDPAGRYPSAGAFVAALRQVARGATAATAVGAPVALPRPAAAAPAPTVATAATAIGTPPPLAAQTGGSYPSTPTPPLGDHVVRQSGPVAASGAPQPAYRPAAQRRGSGAGPWLLAVALALVAGALAMALVMRAQGGAAGQTPAPPPPPTETLAPPTATAVDLSPTVGPAVIATATGEATATPEPASATPEPATATPEPATATSRPPTVAPPPPPATSTPTPTGTATPTASPTGSPTATPTETPTATVTPATPTAVAGCDDGLMAGGFGRLYDELGRVRAGLGCPLRRESAGDGSQQFFAEGMMFYWDDGNRDERADYIFVFYGRDEGRYDELSNEAVAALGDPPTPGPEPNQPVRGFGTVYFNQTGAREQLGAPTSPEIVLQGDQRGVIQFFEQGLMLWTPLYLPTGVQSIFVLYNDGTFERYDDA